MAFNMTERGSPIPLQEFEACVALNHPQLLALAASIVGRQEEAEEVVQASLLKVWKRAAAGEIRELQNYLFHAVRLNALQARARRKSHASIDEMDLPAKEPAGPTVAEMMELPASALEAAVAELPDRQMAVIRLKYYMGLSFREIGETLRISSHTAASACRYALQGLRKRLKPYAQDLPAPSGGGGIHSAVEPAKAVDPGRSLPHDSE